MRLLGAVVRSTFGSTFVRPKTDVKKVFDDTPSNVNLINSDHYTKPKFISMNDLHISTKIAPRSSIFEQVGNYFINMIP